MFIEGIAGYVDSTTVQGVLSGVFVAAGAFALFYGFNRLWQRSLASDAADAIAGAEALGLVISPLGFRAHIEAAGVLEGVSVRIRWKGGVGGEQTLLWLNGSRMSVDFVQSAAQLHAVLGSEE